MLLVFFSTLDGCTGFQQGNATKASLGAEKKAADSPVTHVGSLWPRIARNFTLNHNSNNPEVQAQIKWYMHHQTYLYTMAQQASPYMYYIFQQVRKRDLPGELVLLPFIESAYDPTEYSNVGAAGLWQIMPGTATGFGVKEDWWYDGRRDIYASTNAALDYLTYLENYFNGNWYLAIAAYDSGQGTVQHAIERNAKRDKPTDFWALHLPRETQAYVPKLLALATIVANPKKYPVKLPPLKNAPYIAEVNVGSQIDLAHAAKMAGISTAEIYNLNPGYKRWATDPTGPYHLFLPVDKVAKFEVNLAKLPKSQRVTWKRHTVKPGDTLQEIAKRSDTSTAILRKINHLPSNRIKVGSVLLIPLGTHNLASYTVRQTSHYKRYTGYVPNLPGPKEIIHTVKASDTLWTLADRYDVKVSEIRFWNQLGNQKHLKAGTKLIIWVPKHRHHTQYANTRYRHVPKTYYKVKADDTLSRIANRFHTTVGTLQTINHKQDSTIHPGQVILVPRHVSHASNHRSHQTSKHQGLRVSYQVKKGDSLSRIGEHYGVSIADLRHWNHLSRSQYIHPGQKLVIYRS